MSSNSGTWMLRLWESLRSIGDLVNVTRKSGELNTRKVIDWATTAPPLWLGVGAYPRVSATVIFYVLLLKFKIIKLLKYFNYNNKLM
jgi:hypothetical protein